MSDYPLPISQVIDASTSASERGTFLEKLVPPVKHSSSHTSLFHLNGYKGRRAFRDLSAANFWLIRRKLR
jgi:hypothetical protein